MATAARVRIRQGLAVLGTGMVLAVLATPATAEVVEGPCTGSITYPDGTTIMADEPADVTLELPAEDTVDFEASIDVEAPSEPVDVAGAAAIGLPIGSITVNDWSGQTTLVEASGSDTYSVPSWVPQGSGPIPVEIVHNHGDVDCRAEFLATVAGSPWGVTSVLVLIGTLVFGFATYRAGVDTGTGRGRPGTGTGMGLLFGLFFAASLFTFGAVALDSPVFWILPLAGLILGAGLGSAAPFESRSAMRVDPEQHHGDRP